MDDRSAEGLQQVGGVAVPSPYELWNDGVYYRTTKAVYAPASVLMDLPSECYLGRRRLTYRPLWVSRLGLTVDTQEPLVQLSWFDLATGATQSMWLGRNQIVDHLALAKLGAVGLPVDSVNAKDVLVYLRTQEALNAPTLDTLLVGHRSGPYVVENKLGWLVGKRWIGPGTLEADPRLNQRFTAAFSPSGEADEWFAKWRELRESSWVVRFLMGATFAPPLLRLLKVRTFIVHHWGDSSAGKTATAVFALSAWGNPEVLYSSLNRTAISLTEIFRHLTDLPVLYDEKQVSTVTSEELIYSICTGSGRERGHKDGGLRQDKPTWLTVARTTGEVPLITDSDVGGQFNRVLQVHSVAFTERRQAEAIYPFTSNNFGHAGPMFLEALRTTLDAPNGVDILRRLFAEMREALVNRIGIDSNHAAYAALIAVAQTLSESWLLGIDVTEARERALDDATLALQETAPKKQLSYAERALGKLRDHWIAYPFNYVDDTTEQGRMNATKVGKMIGVETAWGLAFVPHEANEVLQRANYEPQRVWRDFHNNGWLVTEPGSSSALTTISLRNGKSPDHPVYVVKAEVFYNDSVRQTKLRVINGGRVSGLES